MGTQHPDQQQQGGGGGQKEAGLVHESYIKSLIQQIKILELETEYLKNQNPDARRGVQLMASDKATQYPANGFSFRGLTSRTTTHRRTTISQARWPKAAQLTDQERLRRWGRGSRSTATYNGYVCRDRNCYEVCALGECQPVRGRQHAGW